MTALYTALAWICAFVGLAAFAYRLPDLRRRPRDIALWGLCIYFLCSGISFLVDLDQLRLKISGFLGLPNVTSLITQIAVVVLTAAQQVVLVHWSAPPAEARRMGRRRVLFFGAALAALVTASFFVGPVAKSETATSTILLSIQDGGYALYMLGYLLICAIGQWETVRLSLRFTRVANRQWLVVGMRTVTLGASLILVYCVTRGIQIAGTRLDFDAAGLDPVQWTCGSVGALLQVTGWTIPSWGIHLTRVRGWIHSYRAYLRLRPLWKALHQASPDIALDPPRSWPRDLLPPRDPHYSLYRRVVEIRDGQLMLRPFVSQAEFVRVARSLDLPEDPTTPWARPCRCGPPWTARPRNVPNRPSRPRHLSRPGPRTSRSDRRPRTSVPRSPGWPRWPPRSTPSAGPTARLAPVRVPVAVAVLVPGPSPGEPRGPPYDRTAGGPGRGPRRHGRGARRPGRRTELPRTHRRTRQPARPAPKPRPAGSPRGTVRGHRLDPVRRRHYAPAHAANRRALDLAHLAGDRWTARLVHLNHSMLQTHTGHARAALDTVSRVPGARPLPARVDSLVLIRRAHAAAQLGARREPLDLIDRARSRFLDGISRHDPHWAWWIDEMELLGHQGWVMARLGRWDRAIPLLHQAATAPGPPTGTCSPHSCCPRWPGPGRGRRPNS